MVARFVCTLPLALALACASTRPAPLPSPPSEDEALRAAYDETERAYARCTLQFDDGEVPFETWLAGGSGALSLAFFGAATTVAFTSPDDNVAGVSVASLGLLSIASAASATYFGAQIPPALERRSTTGAVLEAARAEAELAIADKDAPRLSFIARQLYEDCRAIGAAKDGGAATVVLQDLQRYRRDKFADDGRFETVERTRDDLDQANAKLSKELADARTDKEKIERRLRALELDAAEHETLNQKLRDRIKVLEDERASLSAKQRKLLEEKRKLEAEKDHFAELTEALKEEVKDGRVALKKLKGGVVVEMPGKVLFPSGKIELDEGGNTTLAKVAAALKDIKDRRFRVEGHTDDVPLSGKGDYKDNWELSAERALTVARYLRDRGINPALLSAEGRAFYAPVASNKSAAGRARNRRIEIYLVPR